MQHSLITTILHTGELQRMSYIYLRTVVQLSVIAPLTCRASVPFTARQEASRARRFPLLMETACCQQSGDGSGAALTEHHLWSAEVTALTPSAMEAPRSYRGDPFIAHHGITEQPPPPLTTWKWALCVGDPP